MTWVKIYDDADAPPDLAKVYASGFRRAARYGGSQSWKAITVAERDRLHAAGLGIQPMYESAADSALTGGYSGGQAQAKAARAFWRSLGCPDDVPIAYAVDTNVGTGDHAALKAYFQGVNAVDTCKPVAYIEDDIGELLYSDGLILGVFTPAAYAWNSPAVLYTPSTAPAHVLWTQEHNGVTSYGGDIDTGHIRSEVNYWGADMALTDADGQTVWNTDTIPNPSFRADHATNPTTQADYALGDVWQRVGDAQATLDALRADVEALKTAAATGGVDVTALATALAPLIVPAVLAKLAAADQAAAAALTS